MTKFLQPEDDSVITETVKSGFGADRLLPYFKHKYPGIDHNEVFQRIRSLGLSGLRAGMGDDTSLSINPVD
jgi:hypothetical protein